MTATPSGRVRMTPYDRRGQLLDLGVRLLSTRSVEGVSIDLLADDQLYDSTRVSVDVTPRVALL